MISQNYFLGLAHVALFTDKYEDTIKFYTKIFPFVLVKELIEVRKDDASGFFPLKYALIKLNDLYIEIMESADKRNFNNIEGAVHHIGIKVADIDKALDFLLKRGFSASKFLKSMLTRRFIRGKLLGEHQLKELMGK